jgi:hypothetical protein
MDESCPVDGAAHHALSNNPVAAREGYFTQICDES